MGSDPVAMRTFGTPQIVTSEERALLLKIARCPLIAEALQNWLPCTEIVSAQQVASADRQVPEGWAGNLREARVLFLSSNPSISEASPGQPADAVEPSPTASSTDDEIVEFIGRRFDQTVTPAPWVRNDRSLLRNGRYWPRPTRFWMSIRARARELLGEAADPARNYVMTEVVHCKSKQEAGVTAAARTCAQLYLEGIVRLSAAPLVAVVGKKAHASLQAWLPSLPDPPYVVRAELGGRQRTLVYISHPSSWGEPKTIEALHGGETLRHLRAIAQGHAVQRDQAAYHDRMTAPGETIARNAGRPDTIPERFTGQRDRLTASPGRPASEPIQPVPGPQPTISEIKGHAVIAARETVRGLPDPAIRIFTGDTAGRQIGDTFDSHHKVNRMPCGIWTILATVESGRLTGGHLPEGTRKLRVNRLG
jgi:hypothetical protein